MRAEEAAAGAAAEAGRMDAPADAESNLAPQARARQLQHVRDQRFIAVSGTMQWTPSARFLLPILALNREYLTMETEVPPGVREAAFLREHLPFLPETALERHLLL